MFSSILQHIFIDLTNSITPVCECVIRSYNSLISVVRFVSNAGNLGGNILSTSPSFRVGSQRGNQLRHTTGGNVNSPMLEAQR